jgi:hypothetical protein
MRYMQEDIEVSVEQELVQDLFPATIPRSDWYRTLCDVMEKIEAACGKLRQVRFRWRGGGSCTVEDTVCATAGREVFVLSKFNGK